MELTTGLCVTGAVLAGGLILYAFIRSKIRRFSSAAFGTPDLVEGIKREQLEIEQTPKSLSSTESIATPRIAEDFPGLSLTAMKSRAAADVTTFLTAMERRDTTAFPHSENIQKLIDAWAEDTEGGAVAYDDIAVHNVVLNRYIKTAENAVLRFQAAVGYGFRRGGQPQARVEDRFELDYAYVLDESRLVGGVYTYVKCPTCGAPVNHLGGERCEYCGTDIVAAVEKIWRFEALRRA